jgi:hypothetical protein
VTVRTERTPRGTRARRSSIDLVVRAVRFGASRADVPDMKACRSSQGLTAPTTSSLARLGRGALLVAVLVVLGACAGAADEAEAPACPDGATLREGVSTSTGSVDTREAAVHRELERLGIKPADDAVASAIIQSSPQQGGETITIGTDDGSVTMTLEPQFPGWRVGSSTWCERSA